MGPHMRAKISGFAETRTSTTDAYWLIASRKGLILAKFRRDFLLACSSSITRIACVSSTTEVACMKSSRRGPFADTFSRKVDIVDEKSVSTG